MRNHSGCDQVGMSFQRLLGLLMMALGLWACTPTEVAKVEPSCSEPPCLQLRLRLAEPDQAWVADEVELQLQLGQQSRRQRLRGDGLAVPGLLTVSAPELAYADGQSVAVRVRARASLGPTGEAADFGGQTVLSPAQWQQAQGSVEVGLQRACVSAPCATPGARRGAAMAYDVESARLLLFGGQRDDGTVLADTWSWDGLGWHAEAPPQSPPARTGHVLTLDTQTGKLLLFGGRDERQLLGDTWQYQRVMGQARWQLLASAGEGPTPRQRAAASSSQGVLLFGGLGGGDAVLSDTWQWDGGRWRQVLAPTDACAALPEAEPARPRCRVGAAMWTGPQGPLLLGGRLGPAQATRPEFDDRLWLYAGKQWQVAPIYRPPAVLERSGHAFLQAPLGSASGSAALVTLGESAVGLRADSYVLDLTSGQFAPLLGVGPGARTEAAVAYDALRDEVIVYGGATPSGINDRVFSYTSDVGWREFH
jgi:hypothetical protein